MDRQGFALRAVIDVDRRRRTAALRERRCRMPARAPRRRRASTSDGRVRARNSAVDSNQRWRSSTTSLIPARTAGHESVNGAPGQTGLRRHPSNLRSWEGPGAARSAGSPNQHEIISHARHRSSQPGARHRARIRARLRLRRRRAPRQLLHDGRDHRHREFRRLAADADVAAGDRRCDRGRGALQAAGLGRSVEVASTPARTCRGCRTWSAASCSASA